MAPKKTTSSTPTDPALAEGTTPAPAEGTTPAPAEGTTPAPAEGTTPAPAEETPDGAAPVGEEVVDETPAIIVHLAELQEALATSAQWLQKAKTLHKNVEKEAKKLLKTSRNRRRGSGNTNANLQKPLDLSDELNALLGNEPGTQMKRPEVTKALNKYADENELKAKDNKREIILNKGLVSMLGNPEGGAPAKLGDKVELFTLLGYLKHHIMKPKAEGSE